MYHALSSTEISPSNLSAIFEEKGTFEVRFFDDENGFVQRPIRYLYAEERVLILDEELEFRKAKLTHYDEDENPHVYHLNINPISNDLIGQDVTLPHYRVELEPVDDSEKGHQDMRMFFDGYTTEVVYPDGASIKQKGIRKAVTDFGIARARIKHQGF